MHIALPLRLYCYNVIRDAAVRRRSPRTRFQRRCRQRCEKFFHLCTRNRPPNRAVTQLGRPPQALSVKFDGLCRCVFYGDVIYVVIYPSMMLSTLVDAYKDDFLLDFLSSTKGMNTSSNSMSWHLKLFCLRSHDSVHGCKILVLENSMFSDISPGDVYVAHATSLLFLFKHNFLTVSEDIFMVTQFIYQQN
jgi:hypothetical protein